MTAKTKTAKHKAAGNGNDKNKTIVGLGGELHQIANTNADVLTTSVGTPISDDENSLRAYTNGPTLLEDFALREKIFHFDHERIPERVVHARGTAAHGFFELTDSLAEFTTAGILSEAALSNPKR